MNYSTTIFNNKLRYIYKIKILRKFDVSASYKILDIIYSSTERFINKKEDYTMAIIHIKDEKDVIREIFTKMEE